MPRLMRFLSCTLTGLLLSLTGFFAAAYLFEGGAGYWSGLTDFLATPAFWYLALLFALLTAFTLLAALVLHRATGGPSGLAGLLGGAITAVCYSAFLIASHAGDWGGMSLGLQKAWPAALVFAAPLALAGAVTAWLWERLD